MHHQWMLSSKSFCMLPVCLTPCIEITLRHCDFDYRQLNIFSWFFDNVTKMIWLNKEFAMLYNHFKILINLWFYLLFYSNTILLCPNYSSFNMHVGLIHFFCTFNYLLQYPCFISYITYLYILCTWTRSNQDDRKGNEIFSRGC